MSAPKKLFVTDIDGTFIRSSLLIELCYELIKRGIFPAEAKRDLSHTRDQWERRQGEYEDYILAVVDVYYHFIKGCSITDVNYIGKMVAEWQRFRVYCFTRDLITYFVNSDEYYCVAISGSPGPVVRPFAKMWGFDEVHCSEAAELDDGKFGDRTSFTFDGKDRIITEMIEKDNPPLILTESVGMGDTNGDKSFLEMMTYPIAFNPELDFARDILENKRLGSNWDIVVERKSVAWRDGKITTASKWLREKRL